jgi:hypothetical protein
MVRPHFKYAAVVVLLLCTGIARAEVSTHMRTGDIASSSAFLTAHRADASSLSAQAGTRIAGMALVYTLPPEPKPTTHWPWWLRILAVIFLLVFIRIVAGSVRSKPSGPSPR